MYAKRQSDPRISNASWLICKIDDVSVAQGVERGGAHVKIYVPRGVLRTFVYGGVRMEGKIQTKKHGFPENFAPKNIGILHISY